jgi:hypothetical protein
MYQFPVVPFVYSTTIKTFGLCICATLIGTGTLYGQSAAQSESAFDSAYAVRITKEEINGVYIPVDVADAFDELKRLSSPVDLEKFRKAPEDLIRSKLHFGLGKWMIVNWGFYEGSRLSHFLKEAGLEHPDDMARALVVCFHRSLNGLDIRFDDEVTFYKAFRDEERAARVREQKVISEEKRIRKE